MTYVLPINYLGFAIMKPENKRAPVVSRGSFVCDFHRHLNVEVPA
jgi:hypothetical protein